MRIMTWRRQVRGLGISLKICGLLAYYFLQLLASHWELSDSLQILDMASEKSANSLSWEAGQSGRMERNWKCGYWVLRHEAQMREWACCLCPGWWQGSSKRHPHRWRGAGPSISHGCNGEQANWLCCHCTRWREDTRSQGIRLAAIQVRDSSCDMTHPGNVKQNPMMKILKIYTLYWWLATCRPHILRGYSMKWEPHIYAIKLFQHPASSHH